MKKFILKYLKQKIFGSYILKEDDIDSESKKFFKSINNFNKLYEEKISSISFVGINFNNSVREGENFVNIIEIDLYDIGHSIEFCYHSFRVKKYDMKSFNYSLLANEE